MPNHVKNVITMSGNEQKIQKVLELIKSDKLGIGTVDFNKIIPMPESLNIESGSRTNRGLKAYREFMQIYTRGCTAENLSKALNNIPAESEQLFLRQHRDVRRDEWELGKTAWHNLRRYGAPTWYEWCCKNWGTKWNAYGFDENEDDGDDNTLQFQTAWVAPHPIVEKLSKMFPTITFEHQWADEDIGCNCGRYSYQNGERIEEYYPESDKEAVEFACDIWGYEPADIGLSLNASGTEYVNAEGEEYGPW